MRIGLVGKDQALKETPNFLVGRRRRRNDKDTRLSRRVPMPFTLCHSEAPDNPWDEEFGPRESSGATGTGGKRT